MKGRGSEDVMVSIKKIVKILQFYSSLLFLLLTVEFLVGEIIGHLPIEVVPS